MRQPLKAIVQKRDVENEDIMEFLIRFDNGAIGTIGTSRIGMGRKLGLGYEIQGTKGSLFYTQERMNEIKLYRHTDPDREKGYKTVYIGPEHPGYKAFFGLAGIGLGYNDQKIIEAHDLITAIALNQPVQPDVRFAYKVNKVIDAVDVSCQEHRWVQVSEFDTEVDRHSTDASSSRSRDIRLLPLSKETKSKETHANRFSNR